MKIAIVHDHLMQAGGAERVLAIFADMYPDAPIYTIMADYKLAAEFIDVNRLKTTYLQYFPFKKYLYRALLPLMPKAIESFDLNEYDVVLSSASSFAKGVKTNSNTKHICYCHTPTRFLWSDPENYIKSLSYPSLIKKFIRKLLPKLKEWDKMAASNVDFFIANSNEVKNRISKYYERESDVVYPFFSLNAKSSDEPKIYFLTGGRLVAYKRFDTVIDAFKKLKLPLVVFGDGPDLKRLKKRAGENISFVGRVSDNDISQLYSQAIAFLHPQYEDFGITAIEAMASGCPVIAFDQGGAAESVVHEQTGVLYDEQSWEALADTVIRFNLNNFKASDLIARANDFSETSFRKKIEDYVNKVYAGSC